MLQYDRELEVLKHLTSAKCSSAPEYIANFQFDEENPWVDNGFLRFVVMSRVPGRPLSEVWPDSPRSPPSDGVLRIWQAFKIALL